MRFEALNDLGWQVCFSFWVEGFRVLMEFPIPEALQSVKDLKNTAMGGIMGLHQSNPDEGFMRAAMATSVTEICTLWMCFCHGACIGHFFFHSWATGAVISRWENAIKPQKLWELPADSGIPEVLSAHHLSSHWRDAPPWATWLVCFIQHLSKHEWFQQVALRCGHASGICPCPQQVPEPSVGLLANKGQRCFFSPLSFIDERTKRFSRSDQALVFSAVRFFLANPGDSYHCGLIFSMTKIDVIGDGSTSECLLPVAGGLYRWLPAVQIPNVTQREPSRRRRFPMC